MKKTFMAIFICSMLIMSSQAIDISAAANPEVIDSGSGKYWDPKLNMEVKYTWKTYQYNKNHVVTNVWFNFKGVIIDGRFIMKKIGNNLNIKMKVMGDVVSTFSTVSPLTAEQFYWKIFRPGLVNLEIFYNDLKLLMLKTLIKLLY